MLLVVTPASRGCGGELLTHLPAAGRDDYPVRAMKVKTSRVPRQADELKHPARPGLLVGDQSLIGNLEQRRRGQHRSPVIGDTDVFAVVMGEIVQIVGVGPDVEEVLKVDR